MCHYNLASENDISVQFEMLPTLSIFAQKDPGERLLGLHVIYDLYLFLIKIYIWLY